MYVCEAAPSSRVAFLDGYVTTDFTTGFTTDFTTGFTTDFTAEARPPAARGVVALLRATWSEVPYGIYEPLRQRR
jgi:hypothetical protein